MPSLKITCLLLNLIFCNAEHNEYVELSHDLNDKSLFWPTPGNEPFQLTAIHDGYLKNSFNWYSTFKFCTSEHIGTHLDAPYHFSKNGWKVNEIPLDRLIAPAVVMDISKKASKNPSTELNADDIVNWLEKYGPLPNNSVILVRTGWSDRYNNKSAYFGDSGSNSSQFSFPGISISAAQIINGFRETQKIHVVGVGIDTPSLDHGPSKDFQTHRDLMDANIYGLENLKNLYKLPAKGAEVIVLPIKIEGSGAPVRVVAKLPSNFATKNALLSWPIVILFLILNYFSV